jgi:hypothetical protein
MKTIYIYIFFLTTVTVADNSMDPDRPDLSGWQANPARRGSLDILLNCVFTILACTWSIQHLNIPGPGDTWREELLRKIKWTLATIVLPELVITQAALEMAMATRSTGMMKEKNCFPVRSPSLGAWWFGVWHRRPAIVESEEWTLTHSFYANMGGYYLYLDSRTLNGNVELLGLVFKSFGLGSIQQNLDLTLLALDHQQPIPLISLTASQIAYCKDPSHFEGVRFGWPSDWVSEEDIKDKAKVPWFTNIIALFQLFSLSLSLVIRWDRHLAAAQLEVVTFVFAICAILVYCFRWFKPQDVKVPTKIWLKFDSGAWQADEDGRDNLERALTKFREHVPDIIWKNILEHDEGELMQSLPRVSNAVVERRRRTELHPFLWTISFFIIGVGALHLIAWSFEFPTYIESVFWKVSCLVAAIVPVAPCLIVPAIHRLLWRKRAKNFQSKCRNYLFEYFMEDNLPAGYNNVIEKFNDKSKELENYRHILLPEVNMERFYSFVKDRGWDYYPVKKLQKVMLEIGEYYRDEADGKNFFPPRNMNLPLRVVFWITAVIYILARLSILALSLGTLRQMPDSVYRATWADVIPNVT